MWPSRRMELWHPESPGQRIEVSVRWPLYYLPRSFATIGEVLRERKRQNRELGPPSWVNPFNGMCIHGNFGARFVRGKLLSPNCIICKREENQL